MEGQGARSNVPRPKSGKRQSRYPSADINAPSSGGVRQLLVAEFAEARSKELELMKKNISEIKGTQRAFQTLPRHLRRRAMSHNIHKIPARLRAKAQHEINSSGGEPAGSTTTKRHRKYKRRPKYILRDYERRQRKYVWLETHLWHAKRMKMTNLWDHKLALHPSDKNIRATYKASAHLCTIHDASYYGCIELSGQEDDVIELFRSLTDPDNLSIASPIYLDGSRSGKAVLYHQDLYPLGAIGPVTYLWRPRQEPDPERRQLWIWIHPAAFKELHAELVSVSPAYNVEIKSLQEELLRFELTGARAHDVIRSVLRPTHVPDTSPTLTNTKVWEILSQLRTPASLPSGAVVALTVIDPRQSFPPKNFNKFSKEPTVRQSSLPSLDDLLAAWPRPKYTSTEGQGKWEGGVAASDLWDAENRKKQIASFYKDGEFVRRKNAVLEEDLPTIEDVRRLVEEAEQGKKEKEGDKMDIDEAKGKEKESEGTATTTATTTPTPPSTMIDTFPAQVDILLIQRKGGLQRGYGAGWDIIVPAHWGMTFWKSFIYAGARAVGLRECRRVANEQNVPYFPQDYPDTMAYHHHMKHVEQEETQKCNARPPGKRPNYKKLCTKSPFAADWDGLFSSRGINLPEEKTEKKGEDGGKKSEASEVGASAMEMEEEEEETKPTRPNEETNKEAATPTEKATVPENKIQPFYVLRGTQLYDVIGEQKARSRQVRQQRAKNQPRGTQWTPKAKSETATEEVKGKEKEKTDTEETAMNTEASPSASMVLLASCLVGVTIKMAPRGTPEFNATICRPSNEDLHLWRTDPSNFQPVIADAEPKDIEHVNQLRPVIGYVTTGDYSLVRGEGHALGYCLAVDVLQTPLPFSMVLIRNPSSVHYHPAVIAFLTQY